MTSLPPFPGKRVLAKAGTEEGLQPARKGKPHG
ncbi:MAG: hypothetical protein H6Q00_304 [Holophagaceae bacterium]|nr:hypothetical protein [Holophagaceae bacterium]